MVILVTGASGQLGQAIQDIASEYPQFKFKFASSTDLDITNEQKVASFFSNALAPFDFCINAAAYTAVDKAESEPEKAELINVFGARNLAISCKKKGVKLVHISTDFVFDGLTSEPYSETSETNPLGIYGKTKLEGEREIINNCNAYFIIRTSWVYSNFGNNFMKTMIRLSSERERLNVVDDQIGSPTNAIDLAHALLTIIENDSTRYGIYNFSNEGKASWYDFALEIFRIKGISIEVNPIPTTAFPTPAKRPKYSVLDNTKIKETFKIEIKSWQEALRQTI